MNRLTPPSMVKIYVNIHYDIYLCCVFYFNLSMNKYKLFHRYLCRIGYVDGVRITSQTAKSGVSNRS